MWPVAHLSEEDTIHLVEKTATTRPFVSSTEYHNRYTMHQSIENLSTGKGRVDFLNHGKIPAREPYKR